MLFYLTGTVIEKINFLNGTKGERLEFLILRNNMIADISPGTFHGTELIYYFVVLLLSDVLGQY